MVQKGQFLERPTLIPVEKRVLEGLWHRGERTPPLLIVPPPPEQGGSMDHVVAAEIAWAVSQTGRATLRFNFAGVGASQGGRGGGAAQRADLRGAITVLRENTGASAVCAAAIGASARLLIEEAARDDALCGLCWISPNGVSVKDILALERPLLVLMGSDAQEDVPRGWHQALAQVGARVEVVERADATFNRNLPHVGRTLARWLSTQFH